MAERRRPRTPPAPPTAQAPASEPNEEDQRTTELDDLQLVRRVWDWARDSFRTFSEWRDDVVENLKLLENDPWTEKEKAYYDKQGREPINMNGVLSPILFISGVQRRTRQEPNLLPQEGGDVRPTEIMNVLLSWVESRNQAHMVHSEVFLDKIGAYGLGFWKYWVDFSEDMEGKITQERIDPLQVLPDPCWLEEGWKSARYVIQAPWYDKEKAIEEWPEKKAEIARRFGDYQDGKFPELSESVSADMSSEKLGDSISSERLFWDNKTKKTRILECWYKERTRVEVAVYTDQLGGYQVTADEERVKLLKEQLPFLPPDQQALIQFVRRPVTKVYVCWVMGDLLLDKQESPYKEPMLPLFPARGHYFWKAPFGLVEVAKDPARLDNRMTMKVAEIVGRAPLSGFFDKNQGGAGVKQIEDYASGVGVRIGYDTEPPTPIPPISVPNAVTQLQAQAHAAVKDVINVNLDMLGLATQRTISRAAIDARQRGGMMAHEGLFDTFAAEQAYATFFLVSLIKQFISPTRALRILGNMAVRDPQNPQVQQFQQTPIMELQAILSEAYDTEYDIQISQKPYEPSAKFGMLQTILDTGKETGVMPPVNILIDLFVESGLLSEKIGAEWKQALQQQAQASAAQQLGGAAGGEPYLQAQAQQQAAQQQQQNPIQQLLAQGVPQQ